MSFNVLKHYNKDYIAHIQPFQRSPYFSPIAPPIMHCLKKQPITELQILYL